MVNFFLLNIFFITIIIQIDSKWWISSVVQRQELLKLQRNHQVALLHNQLAACSIRRKSNERCMSNLWYVGVSKWTALRELWWWLVEEDCLLIKKTSYSCLIMFSIKKETQWLKQKEEDNNNNSSNNNNKLLVWKKWILNLSELLDLQIPHLHKTINSWLLLKINKIFK